MHNKEENVCKKQKKEKTKSLHLLAAVVKSLE
jgi:hypothetical protein